MFQIYDISLPQVNTGVVYIIIQLQDIRFFISTKNNAPGQYYYLTTKGGILHKMFQQI